MSKAQNDEQEFAKFYKLTKNGEVRVSRGGSEVKYEVSKGILLRKFKSAKVENGREFNHMIVPKLLRDSVMSVAHDAPFRSSRGKENR